MTQELVTTQENLPATQATDLASWGKNEFSLKDLVLPRILMMQPTSQHVTEGQAKFGEFVNSLTNEIMGDITQPPLNFIPILMTKVWLVYSKTQGPNGAIKLKFLRADPITLANENLPWNDKEDGIDIKREYVRQFYILLENDMSMPYVLSLKSTSSKAAQVLATQMYTKNAMAKLAPCAVKMSFGATKEKNDKGSFLVAQIKLVGRTSQEDIENAYYWYHAIQSGIVGVDLEESQEAPETIEATVNKPVGEMFDNNSKF